MPYTRHPLASRASLAWIAASLMNSRTRYYAFGTRAFNVYEASPGFSIQPMEK
jgi:hypothetical protein